MTYRQGAERPVQFRGGLPQLGKAMLLPSKHSEATLDLCQPHKLLLRYLKCKKWVKSQFAAFSLPPRQACGGLLSG